MTRAYQCDRCFDFDIGTPVLKVELKTTEPPVKTTEKELCPNCLAKLNDWLDAYLTNPDHTAT
jgi:hypothetical protein